MNYSVIYHHPCLDGFTAAWVIRRWARLHGHEIDWHPANYGQEPYVSWFEDKHVILADFCYKREALLNLLRYAASVTIYDHHATAKDEIAAVRETAGSSTAPMTVVFDDTRSGAGIVWDELFDRRQRPWLVDDVEDRDLWRFAIHGSRFVNMALFSYEYSFDDWDDVFIHRSRAEFVTEGRAIHRKLMKDIREFREVGQRHMSIAGYRVPVMNLPYFYASEAAGLMAEEDAPETFAACYYDSGDGFRRFSLRSRQGGMDVRKIAEQYGGGGHPGAAGFEVSLLNLDHYGLR